MIDNFVFKNIRFDDEDYARLRMVFRLFDDFIEAETFDGAGMGQGRFLVDPLDLGVCLSGMAVVSGVLPRNCVFWSYVDGSPRIGIYVAPKIWPVSVVKQKETWHVPLPGFVFVGHQSRYGLYAVKDLNVTADSELFVAPVPNMNDSVCVGNVPFPMASNETIWKAVGLFFESGFNNHLANNKSKNYPGGILDLWKVLHNDKATEYPVGDMIPTGKTLGVLAGGGYV